MSKHLVGEASASMRIRLDKLTSTLLVVAVAGCSIQDEPDDAGGQNVFPLVLAAEDLDLGTIWATPDFHWRLHVRNTSSREAEVTDFKISCGCSKVDFSPVTIAPGERREIALELDVSRSGSFSETGDERSFRAKLLPIVKGYSGAPASWEITGTVRRLLRLSTSSVQFDETWSVGHPLPVETVDVVCAVPLASLTAEGDRSAISCKIEKRSDVEYGLKIRPSKKLRPGPFRVPLKLIAEVATGERVESQVVTAHGCVPSEVELSPYSLNWGAVLVGRVRESHVIVRSMVGKPFEIESITSDSDNVDVHREDSRGNGVVLIVNHRIAAVGNHRNHVGVLIRNHDGAALELPITLSYCGVPYDR